MGPHYANVFGISSIPHLQVTSTVEKGRIYQVIQDSNKKLEFKPICMSLLLILEKNSTPKMLPSFMLKNRINFSQDNCTSDRLMSKLFPRYILS